MSSKLFDYLVELNTSENQWGIWVNPEAPTEDFRIGQFCFSNGGINDNWICIGSLEELSFGFQSLGEAIEMWLKDHKTASYNDTAVIDYKERKTLVSIGGILAAYQNGYLSNEFEDWLEKQIKPILKVWAEEETNNFIYEKLPLLLENDYE